jgi:polyhydroxyalkanoate synthesis regulator phasin
LPGILEKSLNLGLGLLLLSREKAEEIVDELVNKGEVSRRDAQEFVNDLVKRGEAQREQFRSIIKEEITKAVDALNLAKKEDIVSREELKAIIRAEVVRALRDEGVVTQGGLGSHEKVNNSK